MVRYCQICERCYSVGLEAKSGEVMDNFLMFLMTYHIINVSGKFGSWQICERVELFRSECTSM